MYFQLGSRNLFVYKVKSLGTPLLRIQAPVSISVSPFPAANAFTSWNHKSVLPELIRPESAYLSCVITGMKGGDIETPSPLLPGGLGHVPRKSTMSETADSSELQVHNG